MTIWDIRPLFTATFWFSTTPPPLLPFFEKAFFILYLITMVAAGILWGIERRTHDGILRAFAEKLRRAVTTWGAVGLLLSFFSYERTPFLSMRFLTALLWVGIFFWGLVIVHWRLRVAPKLQQIAAERRQFEQYLPK